MSDFPHTPPRFSATFTPAVNAEIRRAAASGIYDIRGGGTKDFYGQQLAGDALDTRGYAGIIDYDPTELVITARAGTGRSQAA